MAAIKNANNACSARSPKDGIAKEFAYSVEENNSELVPNSNFPANKPIRSIIERLMEVRAAHVFEKYKKNKNNPARLSATAIHRQIKCSVET